ncbi:hypothetical protein CL654_01550 [bacterium]|nr:hypothetical protein [bacterium]|tara:strand:+ start:5024 stop:5500 length:477 start_codon:yes stop_codon:yes gene_type:complete
MLRKQSFLDKLTGGIPLDEEEPLMRDDHKEPIISEEETNDDEWIEEDAEEGQLTVDVFQNPNEIVIKTMVAGVKPEDIDVSINREMVTIKGRRHQEDVIEDKDFYFKELYWGGFSRTILLPEEVDPDGAQATETNGLLTIRLPKHDKAHTKNIKVKSR